MTPVQTFDDLHPSLKDVILSITGADREERQGKVSDVLLQLAGTLNDVNDEVRLIIIEAADRIRGSSTTFIEERQGGPEGALKIFEGFAESRVLPQLLVGWAASADAFAVRMDAQQLNEYARRGRAVAARMRDSSRLTA